MAVRGGILASLCFLEILDRKAFKLISLDVLPFFVASWSSIKALATSAQHRRNRSLSGASSAPFFFVVVVAVIVVVAMVRNVILDKYYKRDWYCFHGDDCGWRLSIKKVYSTLQRSLVVGQLCPAANCRGSVTHLQQQKNWRLQWPSKSVTYQRSNS